MVLGNVAAVQKEGENVGSTGTPCLQAVKGLCMIIPSLRYSDAFSTSY